MQKIELRKLGRGGLFRLAGNDDAPVWVRGYYCRTEKVYEAYKYDDTNHEGFFKGNRKVFVVFEF